MSRVNNESFVMRKLAKLPVEIVVEPPCQIRSFHTGACISNAAFIRGGLRTWGRCKSMQARLSDVSGTPNGPGIGSVNQWPSPLPCLKAGTGPRKVPGFG